MTSAELDEVLIFYWPMVINRALETGNAWAVGFAKSIAKHGRNPNWTPSPRQEASMLELLEGVRHTTAPAPELIDDKPMTAEENAIARVRACFARAETIHR